jgi:glyoxylase-like metal-dependent hydrolase (beta-lactamase superfamily II)
MSAILNSAPDRCIRLAGGAAGAEVYCLETGQGINRSNVYFVRSGSSWVLIDAASADCGGSIRTAAETIFGLGARPSSVLLTHDHPDHAGSAVE